MANRNLATTITIGGAVSGALSAAIGRTQGKLRELGNSIRSLKAQQTEMARTTGTQTVQYQRLTAQIDRLRVAQSRLAQIERQRQQNLERRDQLGGEIGQAAATAAAVNLPIIGSVRQASEFGRQLQLIGNTANMTDAEVRGLGDTIMRISKSTSQSATNVQGAIGFLVAAGMDVKQAASQLEAIGRTATATGSEIEDVAKAAFTMGDALKIEPGNMQKALEALVAAGKEGNFEFRDMAAELPSLGAAFGALKMTGQDAVVTMGAALQIARKGAGTSGEAANNLANFLAKVLSPETLKKAERLGSDLYGVVSGAQARGENPLVAAIDEIGRITKGGDQKLLGELFADMQVQSFLRPMLQNRQEFDRIMRVTATSTGAIDRDFERMRRTMAVQLEEIGNSLKRAAVVIGTSLAPVLERVSAFLVPLIDRFAAFTAENPKLVGGVLAAASALSILGVAVKVVAFGFTYLKGAYLAVQGVIAGARAGGALAQLGSAAATSAGWLLRLKSILGMVGTTIAAIATGPVLVIGAAVVALAVAIVRYWEYVKAFFVGFGQGLMDGVKPAFDEIGKAVAPLKPLFDGLMEAVSSLLTPVKATAEELFGVTNAGQTVGEVVGAALGLIMKAVMGPVIVIGKMVGLVQELIALWPVFELAAVTAWESIKSKVGAIVDWLMGKIAPLMNGIGWIGDKAAALGARLGITDAPAAAAPGAAGLPQPQMRGGGAPNVTNTNTYEINVQQQPGQSNTDLAREIDRRMREREAQRQRGALYDTVAP